MKVKKIKVPYYKHTIISTIADSKDSGEEILKLMKRYHIPAEHIESVRTEFDGGANGLIDCRCCHSLAIDATDADGVGFIAFQDGIIGNWHKEACCRLSFWNGDSIVFARIVLTFFGTAIG